MLNIDRNGNTAVLKKGPLLEELRQVQEARTIERAKYYLERLKKGVTEIKTSKINDINLNRWKEYTDTLCLYATLHKLSQTNIKTLALTHHAEIFVHNFPFIPKSSILHLIRPVAPESDPGYHTDIETQQKIFKLVRHLI